MSRVFRKTALGIATFTKQNSGLMQAQRAMLIMVDGKRSASDLRRFGATFGNVNLLLRDLYDGGLIELDPAYVEKVSATQSDIAKENELLGMSFGTETAVGNTRTQAVTAAASEARDLRDLMNAAPVRPAAPAGSDAKSAPLTLALAPIDGDGGDDLPIASVSAATLFDAKAFAKRYVFDALGNSGTALCLAIDRADDLKSFMSTIKIAGDTLRDMKGDEAAQGLPSQVKAILLS